MEPTVYFLSFLFFLFFFFLVVLGIKLRASHLLGTNPTHSIFLLHNIILEDETNQTRQGRCQWLMPVILATQEADIRRVAV
jgi:hypothetical protein